MRSALKKSWLLKMWPIGCPETSVRSYRYRLRDIPKERISLLLRGGSLESRKKCVHGLCQYSTRRSQPPPSKSLPITLYQSSYHSRQYMLTVPNDKLGNSNIQLANKLRRSFLRAASEVLLSLFLVLHKVKSGFCAFCTWGTLERSLSVHGLLKLWVY